MRLFRHFNISKPLRKCICVSRIVSYHTEVIYIDSSSVLPCSAAMESGESPLQFCAFTLTPLHADKSSSPGSGIYCVDNTCVVYAYQDTVSSCRKH